MEGVWSRADRAFGASAGAGNGDRLDDNGGIVYGVGRRWVVGWFARGEEPAKFLRVWRRRGGDGRAS